MSKARLVVTAMIVEKRPVAEVARACEVARSWVYTLVGPPRVDRHRPGPGQQHAPQRWRRTSPPGQIGL